MIPINILCYGDWKYYQLESQPGPKNKGGGPFTKYARLNTFPEVELILKPEEATRGIVFADWLYFHENKNISDEKVKSFLELEADFKGIIGTELKFLTWLDTLRSKLIKNVDCITHVNAYQRDLYKTVGIENSKFLADPVPEHLFYPAQKQRRLVCMGKIGWNKRTQLVIDLFKALKDTSIETCYLGGASMWGSKENLYANELQKDLEEVTGVFIENATQQQVAYVLNSSMFYAHVAWHDVSPISQRENMMAGNVSFSLTHPGLREVTPYNYTDIEEMVAAILAYPDEKFAEDSAKARDFAIKTNSYQAWRKQLNLVLEIGGDNNEIPW